MTVGEFKEIRNFSTEFIPFSSEFDATLNRNLLALVIFL